MRVRARAKVRLRGLEKRLGLAHEHKSSHICSLCEAATDEAEVFEEIALTREEIAARLLMIEIFAAVRE